MTPPGKRRRAVRSSSVSSGLRGVMRLSGAIGWNPLYSKASGPARASGASRHAQAGGLTPLPPLFVSNHVTIVIADKGDGKDSRAGAPGGWGLAGEVRGAERQPYPMTLVVGDRRERRPHVGGRDATEDGERLFHAVVHVHERGRVEDVAERSEPLVHALGAWEVARLHGGEELGLEVRRDAAHARDASVGAQQKARHERHREGGEHGDRTF